ncbi:VolA/Pla-1 family phospholipase [Catenovulum adriaticum]|uniref:Bacterial virulence factor lipase N-terminal domain-containing protein n=1 Tax=Catenovulum adriaticum TaxID=2984846 RepID=A0ABY7AS34_9ALTE|nr:VolA/Pla-1 family phospholipase [Catenovulum sp. TS8]WAJ71476.1 hypothetical protein OLW01_06675 [Catenovulum sp. TS8]
MHKRNLCAISVGLVLLAGCDGDTLSDINKASEGQTVIPSSKIVYSPADGELSIPNDLLFSETQDGTLNLPVDDASDFTDPIVAVSSLDGWSYQQPFLIEVELDSRVNSLNEASIAQAGAVRLFESVMGGDNDANHPECKNVPQGQACKVLAELTFGVDFVTSLSGQNQIAVIPLKPLKLNANYLISVSNQITDSENNAVAMSSTYKSVRQDLNTQPLATDAQKSLQAVINSFETALAEFGVDKQNLILTAAMTTQSAPSLSVIKSLLVQNPQTMPVITQPQPVEVNGQQLTTKDVLLPQAATCPDMLALAQSGLASDEQIASINQALPFCINKMYQASISLPYYSGVATAENKFGATGDNAWWQARCDSGATLQGAIMQGQTLPTQAQSENDQVCMSFGLRDLGLDSDRHITQYNPVPKMKAMDQLDVQITVPDPVYLTATSATVTQMPEAGWPVVIMQHGIGSKKEDMLALTGALGQAGFATVSIDMTLHGSRGFDTDDDGNLDVQANPESVTAFMNLENARATRDNLKQGVADLLGLRVGLANLSQTEFSSQKLNNQQVYFIGHSLGGIVGVNFTTLANTELAPSADPLFDIKASVFANAAGGIANFLLDSNSFGNFIKGNIVLSNYQPFLTYLAENQINIAELLADETIYASTKTNFIAQAELDSSELGLFELAEGYFLHLVQNGVNVQALGAQEHLANYPVYLQSLSVTKQATLNSLVNQFAFAMQTVIDSADPNHYAVGLQQTQTPVLITEIWGDGTPATWDETIPPKASGSPIAGTEGLAQILALPSVTESIMQTEAISGIVRFNAGSHSSLLSPEKNAAVTKEMQLIIAKYFASEGQAILLEDTSVISQ